MNSIWTFLIDRFRITALITVGILIAGTLSYQSIPRETEPEIDIPAANISTVWPGASPGDVETLVTNVIEREIQNVDGITEFTSISQSGLSIISIEFDTDEDKAAVLQDVKDAVDSIQGSLPDTLPDDPTVTEVSFSDVPILTLNLSGPYAWSELKAYAEQVEETIENVALVKEVTVSGAPTDVFHIFVDPIRLQAYNLNVGDLIRALQSADLELPLGEVRVGGQSVEVSVESGLENVLDMMNVPIREGLLVQDIASIRKEFAEFTVETFFFTGQDGARPAVSIEVIKSSSKGNAITLVDELLAEVEALKTTGDLPPELEVTTSYNRADEIQESLGVLVNSGGQTLILIAIVMLIALGWKESLLASLSIPLALLTAIIALLQVGESFNGISLFALVLGVGLLVDNSIIVVEGMSEAIYKHKMSPEEAARDTIKTYAAPIVTGTLTTICAFFPMLLFITGVSGDYIRVIPLTITFVLVGALLISLILLPSIGVKFYTWFPPKLDEEEGWSEKLQRWYEKRIRTILSRRRWSALTVVISLVAFVLSVSLVTTNKVPVEVFPASDFPFFVGEIELPEGTSVDASAEMVDIVSPVLDPYFETQPGESRPWLESVVFTVGRASSLVQEPGAIRRDESHVTGIAFQLSPVEERETPSFDIAPQIEAAVKAVLPPEAEYTTLEATAGPPTGAAIGLRVLGYDADRQEAIADQLIAGLEQIPDVENVRDDRADTTLQMKWAFDREKLLFYGVTPGQVAENLRASVNGITVLQIVEGDEELDVNLRLDWSGQQEWTAPDSLEAAKAIPLYSPVTGQYFTLEDVATVEITPQRSAVRHKDGVPIVSVLADLPPGVTASQKQADIDAVVEQIELQPGERIEIGGDAEEGNRLLTEMATAMGFAVVLILLVLVWQFNRFHQAIFTLGMIPLSLTAVFVGFWLSGRTITFPTMIGIVSLAGIIVNDAIVLIDQFNIRQREEGLSWVDAMVGAGGSRLQPIILTSVTTVVGMLPLSLSDEIWGGLGFAIVYGMAMSTILILVMLPAFIRTWFDLGDLRRRFFAWLRGGAKTLWDNADIDQI